MLSYYQTQRPDGSHVQRYIGEKSTKLLNVLGEKTAKGAEWMIHSHGGWLRVETDKDDLFERVIIVLPRPEQHSSKLFTPWAEGRLKHYARYIERTNSGRVVRFIIQKQVVIAIAMRRKGYDLQDPSAPLPNATDTPKLLKLFCREISMYINWMSDQELSFVQALKLTVIPQARNPSIPKFTLDILPTVLGLRGKSIPLNPVTLVRGVIGEIAEQLDLRGYPEIDPDAEGLDRLWDYLKRSRIKRENEACIQELDRLAARIDLLQPDFPQMSQWVSEFDGGSVKPLIPVRLVFACLSISAGILLYLLR